MRLAWMLVVVGCSGSSTSDKSSLSKVSEMPAARVGVPPPSDEAGLRAAFAPQVGNGGLWFADATCQAQFSQSRTIASNELDAFAHCLAGLHLRATGRADALDDTSVLADDNGFEIEARVVGGRLDFIGFSSRNANVATITPDALESIRVAGDRNATIAAAQVEATIEDASLSYTETLQLCLSETGEIASVTPVVATSPEALAAFSAIVRGWKFKPFVAGGKPIAVCSIAELHYPASTTTDRGKLPRPRAKSKAGNPVWNVRSEKLRALRTAGDTTVVPDDLDKMKIANNTKVVGTFKMCIDETGHFESGVLVQSTGLPNYDAKLVRAMMAWTFKPYQLDGVAVPVCGDWTFIYTQKTPVVIQR